MNDVREPLVVRSIPHLRMYSGHSKPVEMYVSTEDLAGVVGVELAAVDLSQAAVEQWFTAPHVHDRAEMYLCIESASNVVIDVDFAGTVQTIGSPFAAWIPPGISHRFRVRRRPKRPCFLLGIFPLETTVNRNLHERKERCNHEKC